MGYHIKEIEKGVLGNFSKIIEEYEELLDAYKQDNAILELCELCDLMGAIEAYISLNYNLELKDLIKMMNATKEAFQEGHRN